MARSAATLAGAEPAYATRMMRAFPPRTELVPALLAISCLALGVGASSATAPQGPGGTGPSSPTPQGPGSARASATAPQAPAKRTLPDGPRPPRSALARASPPEVAEWIRTVAGRPINRAEAAALLREWGVDTDSDPARREALGAALEGFRARWDAFAGAELIPMSEQRGTSLADLTADPAQSASFVVDLRTRRHALEDAMLDECARALPDAMRARVELAKAARGSQVPGWAAGSLMPAGTTTPLMSIAWEAAYVPEARRDEVRRSVESALVGHAPQRGRLMDGLLRAALESDLMADRVSIEVQEAARKIQESGSKVDGNAVLAVAMSRQLLPVMCAAGDVQASNAQMLEALKGALAPKDFSAMMQAYARAASVPLSPQLDPDAALANMRADGGFSGAQVEAIAAIADAWRADDAVIVMSYVQSLPELSRSMCASLGELRWNDPATLSGQSAPGDGPARVQQRQMQLVQVRAERATAAVDLMKSQVSAEEWNRIRPTKPLAWPSPK